MNGSNGPKHTSITETLAGLSFLADRSPHTTDDEADGAFAILAAYRDGGIYVGHWAGTSAWERHGADELVIIVDGETELFFSPAKARSRRS